MRLDILPSPTMYSDWKDWADALITQIITAQRPDEAKANFVASSASQALSATTAQFVNWGNRLVTSRRFLHSATGTNSEIILNDKGDYVVCVDLGLSATAAQSAEMQLYLNGVEYSTSNRAAGSGNNFRIGILGGFIKVEKGDKLKVAVFGSATTLALATSRIWVRKL